VPRYVLMLRQPERDQKVAELEAPTAEAAVARFADRLYAVPVERAPRIGHDGRASRPAGRKRAVGTLVYRGVAYEREVAGPVTTYRRGERWAPRRWAAQALGWLVGGDDGEDAYRDGALSPARSRRQWARALGEQGAAGGRGA
jgi:hypothetical protein